MILIILYISFYSFISPIIGSIVSDGSFQQEANPKKVTVKKKVLKPRKNILSSNQIKSSVTIPGENEIVQLPKEEQLNTKSRSYEDEPWQTPVDTVNNSKSSIKSPINQIYTNVDQQAEFPGGPRAFGDFLKKNIVYPPFAQRANEEGKVYVQFVVNTDGSIQDVQVLRSAGFSIDMEAVRIIKLVPRWLPGKLNGQLVRSHFTQPITFTLADDKNKTEMHGAGVPTYNSEAELNKWNESKLIEYFSKGNIGLRQGIYEEISNENHKYKLAFIEEENNLKLIYIKNSSVKNSKSDFYSFKEGELKADLFRTANENVYKAKWLMANKSINENVYVLFKEFSMEVKFTDNPSDNSIFLKLYPTYKDQESSNHESASSGTGFAITSNGVIATNYHVISGAKTIKIKGINGDFSKTYAAKILVEDKNNDLALLQIEDSNFISLGVIPYVIKNNPSDVGTSIFVLGYPLPTSMGDEIKLTDGIISSKSGFKGDITSYQISAPVQPGNSGGPLFDKNGNLIGIINSKIMGAQNVSYAIKASYLTNLLNQIIILPKLQTKSISIGKTLPEQKKLIEKFTYKIEVN